MAAFHLMFELCRIPTKNMTSTHFGNVERAERRIEYTERDRGRMHKKRYQTKIESEIENRREKENYLFRLSFRQSRFCLCVPPN